MLRLVLLSLGAALYVTGAQAHQVHGGCAFGNTHSGEMMHYHPGAYGNAVPCGGGGGYGGGYQEPPPRYRGGYGGGYHDPPIVGPGYRGGGGYGGGGGGYYEEAPPPDYYGGGGGYRRGYGGGGRPGDYGPQTNRGQDCYNIGGQRICCPKGWTVQGGQCAPYRGR